MRHDRGSGRQSSLRLPGQSASDFEQCFTIKCKRKPRCPGQTATALLAPFKGRLARIAGCTLCVRNNLRPNRKVLHRVQTLALARTPGNHSVLITKLNLYDELGFGNPREIIGFVQINNAVQRLSAAVGYAAISLFDDARKRWRIVDFPCAIS